MDWQQTTLGPPMTTVFWGLIRTAPEKRDMPAINKAAARLGDLYGILDARLARQHYITGPTLALCDISIGVHAHRWMSFQGIDKPAHPNLHAWYDRLLARKPFKEHVSAPPT
jgi:glutathione S-transferase